MIFLEYAWPHPIQIPLHAVPSVIREGVRHDSQAIVVPTTPEEIAAAKKQSRKDAYARWLARNAAGKQSPLLVARISRYTAIRELLQQHNGLSVAQVVYRLGSKPTTTKTDMRRMYEKGVLSFDVATGKYYAR